MKRLPYILAVVLCGCVGTDVGNPPDDDSTIIAATLEFELHQEEATPGALRHHASFESAWLSIDAIRVTHGDCEAPDTSTIEGPFYADLLKRRVLPSAPVIDTSSPVCSVKIELDRAEGDDVPASLAGRTFFISGRNEEGPFEIESASRRQLPYKGLDFVIEQDARYFDSFDSSDWLDALDPHRNLNDENGGANSAAFFNEMKNGSRIVKDDDSNGIISSSERERAVALPDQAVGP